jgi:biotin carboxyl carrier protein
VKYYVTLQGDEYEVDLDALQNKHLRARVEGQEFDVQLSVVEHLQRYSVLLNRESFDVVVDSEGSEIHLQVGPYRLDMTVENERERAARTIGAARPKGPATIHSSMPGVIRALLVAEGDSVEAGQPLLILEAMKMENEICAEQDGQVTRLIVTEGQAVEGGAPLLSIE